MSNVTVPDNPNFAHYESSNFWLTLVVPVYIVPLVLGAGALEFTRRKHWLGFRHRRSLSKVVDLMVLSQVLLITAGYDQMALVECDPEVLYAYRGDSWTHINTCQSMISIERALVDCSWASTLEDIVRGLSVYSGILTFMVLWAFVESVDGSVHSVQTYTVSTLITINCIFWTVYLLYASSKAGTCRIQNGALSTAILFVIMSYMIVVAEIWIPNYNVVHTVFSEPDITNPEYTAALEEARQERAMETASADDIAKQKYGANNLPGQIIDEENPGNTGHLQAGLVNTALGAGAARPPRTRMGMR